MFIQSKQIVLYKFVSSTLQGAMTMSINAIYGYLLACLELKNDTRAVTALEYGLIAALIAAVIITAVTTLGTNLNTTFVNLAKVV
jgi:pilus assembly protein Flp/PilA